MKLSLQRSLLVAQQHQGPQGPCQGIDACASLCIATARLRACNVCLLHWKLQASILVHVHVHELYSAEYPCMVKVCAPCVGQRCVYMYIIVTKMTRTRANFTSLVCTAFFALRCVLCCPGTSESVSLRLAPECSALPSFMHNLSGRFFWPG